MGHASPMYCEVRTCHLPCFCVPIMNGKFFFFFWTLLEEFPMKLCSSQSMVAYRPIKRGRVKRAETQQDSALVRSL